MRFTSLLSPPKISPLARRYSVQSRIPSRGLVTFLVWEIRFSKCQFRNHSNFSSEFFIKERSTFSCKNFFSPFPPLNAFFSKAAFFIAATVTWTITWQIYVGLEFHTIEELGIFKITWKPLDAIRSEKKAVRIGSEQPQHTITKVLVLSQTVNRFYKFLILQYRLARQSEKNDNCYRNENPNTLLRKLIFSR